ncbi:MAG: class I SAM-dependent methyltransferase [Myxococcales bacterium]
MTIPELPTLEVLESLEAPPVLAPYLDELLCDLPHLGTDPLAALALLRRHGLAAGARAVDLGCGSGIVSVALAGELGCSVEGIDGHPPFVERAVRRAAEAGVADRCRFRAGDLREALSGRDYDLAIFGAVGGVLGSLEETVRRVREVLRPGGLLLLDHAFARAPAAASPAYPLHEEALTALTRAGDTLLAESAADAAEIRACNEQFHRLIAARAEAIARRVPGVASALAAYLARQTLEEANLELAVRPVLWLLRKGGR